MGKKTVEIEENIYSEAEKIAKKNSYSSLDGLVEAMLKDLIGADGAGESPKQADSDVQERLRKLGYVD